MKRIYLFIVVLFIVASTQGQTSILFERTQTILSPSEQNYHSLSGDLSVKQNQQLYSNPAFYEIIYRNDSIFPAVAYKSILSAGYANGEQKGDYLTSEGNNFFDYRIMGSGEYSLPAYGTLFGSIQYARGEHKNIGWNGIRHSELYQPYVLTDSIGGNFKYEDYQAEGGYSFRLGDYYLGFSGKYHGEQAHRVTDPRALNKTTWLGFDLGVGKLYKEHLLMFQAGYERNKQHVQLRFWRPGEQERFFVAYGFGMYDINQSKVGGAHYRMYYIDQGRVGLSYLSPQRNSISLYAHVGYKYNHMKTEESSSRNNIVLYFSKTHQIEPTLRIDFKATPSLNLSLTVDGTINMRKGFENIFDTHLVDENLQVYDYRKIDTQQNYNRTVYTGFAQLKAGYQINNMHKVDLLLGSSLFMREEKYQQQYKIKNQSVSPHVGIAYSMKYKRSEFDITGMYTYQHLLDNEYDVDIHSGSIDYLDFQHAFTPYAYYNSTYSAINLNATYIYHLNKNALGLNLKLMYKKGDRDKDTVYSNKIGFNWDGSPAPTISASPDKHDEVWGAVNIFYMF